MKTFKDFIAEVQKPLSKGEAAFKHLHNPINHKDLVPGVTDQEHVFNGSPQRKDPKTASYEGDASSKAYDKNLKVEESLEEKHLTPNEKKKREEIVTSLKAKGMPPGKAFPIATATAKRVTEEEDDGWYAHREMHGSKGVSKEDWKKGVRLNSKGERVQMKKEEVEQIDELDRDGMVKRYAEKARKKVEYGEEPVEKRAAGRLLAGKKRWGGAGGIPAAKVPAVTREEAEIIDERNKENKFKKDLHVASVGKSSIDKFDLDHDKMAKDFGHTRDQVRDTMKSRLKTFKRVGRQITREESEQIDELSRDALMKYGSKAMDAAHDAKAKGDRKTASKRYAGVNRASSKLFPSSYKNTPMRSWVHASEEVEQVDEISKSAALNYIGAASYDKSSHASDIGAINQVARTTGTNASQRAERDALSKKHGNRSLGIQRAAHKLAGKNVKVPATEETEIVNELDDKRNSILKRYLAKTGSDSSRKAGRKLAMNKLYADEKFGDADLPKISAKIREEAEEIEEGMPSSVIKTKQRYAEMSDADFAKAHGNKSEKALQSMAWSHGYGKPGTPGHNHYVNRVKKGMSSEELELDEAKRGRPSKNPEKKDEVASDADQNIQTQLHKSLSVGKHVAFKNGDVKQIPAAHAQKALHMLKSAKPAQRLEIQNSLHHSHDRFTKTVTHGRPVVDHPGIKKVSVAKSVKEALDPVGREDSDVDNDGKKNTKSDKYLLNRRKSIKSAIKNAVKEALEMSSSSVAAAAASQRAKGQSSTENMQQDSINKIKQDPLASSESIKLPPTQGNEPIGGEGETSRVSGKYSMEEEVILNNLYDFLSDDNKAIFEELIETDEGIEKLLSFAKEQGLE